MKTNDTKAQYELAKKDIAEIISTITSPEPLPKLESDGNVEFTSTYSKKNSAKWLRKPRSTSLTATSSNVLFQEDLRRITKFPHQCIQSAEKYKPVTLYGLYVN